MQRTTLPGMTFGFVFLCLAGILFASEGDELREKAKGLQQKASALAKQGKTEAAGRLKKESAKLLEAAEQMEQQSKGHGERGDRPGIDKEVQKLQGHLQDLRAKKQTMRDGNAPEQELAEVREQISNTERELKKIHSHHGEAGKHRPELREQAEKLDIARRRIHHMRVAAQNLKMAEMHDLAHQVMEQAQAMERDVQEAKQRLAGAMHEGQERHGEHGPDVVRELRGEIERLRAEVRELSQKIEKR